LLFLVANELLDAILRYLLLLILELVELL